MFFFDTGDPPLGTILYTVHEHLYHRPGRAGPFEEYVVFAGEIMEHLHGPKKLMRLDGPAPEGHILCDYRSFFDLGKTVFFSAREAALQAKAKTEDYERRWAWTEKYGDVPLRRPWESLLKEEAYHENHQE